MQTNGRIMSRRLLKRVLLELAAVLLGAALFPHLAIGQTPPAPAVAPEAAPDEGSAPAAKTTDCDRLHLQKVCVRVYRSIVDYKDVDDIFGPRIAKRFLVLQVTVVNRDKDYQYLINDISLYLGSIVPALRRKGNEGYELSSDDLSLLRGVAEKGQSADPRNVVLRGLRGAGSVAAGLIGVSRFGKSYAPAVAVWNGPFVAAFSDIFPDYTINQMNRLNDSAYNANTIIPKQQSKVMAIFVPQAIFLTNEQQKTFRKEPTTLWKDVDLRKIDVLVDGNFITNLEDVGPTLTSASIPPNEMKAFASDNSEVKGAISGRFLSDCDVKLLDADANLGIRLDGTPTDTRIGFVVTAKLPVAPGTVLKIGVSKKGQDQTKETDLAVQYAAPAPTLGSADQDTINQGDTDKVLTLSGTNFLPGATQIALVPADGVTVSTTEVTDSKTLTVKVTATESAPAIQRQMAVITPGGTSPGLALKVAKKE